MGFEVNLNLSMLPAYSTWINQLVHASSRVENTTAENRKQKNTVGSSSNPSSRAEGSTLFHLAVCDVPLLLSLFVAPGRPSSYLLSGFLNRSIPQSVSDLAINLPPQQFEQIGSFETVVGRIRSAYLKSVFLQFLNLGLFRMQSLRQLVGVFGMSAVSRRTIISRNTRFLQRTHTDPSVGATGPLECTAFIEWNVQQCDIRTPKQPRNRLP